MAWFECVGGGSSGPTETVLVNTSSSTTRWASPLVFSSFNISDYDYIKIEGTSQLEGYTWNISPIFDVRDMPISDASGNGCTSIGGSAYIGNVNDNLYIWTSTGKNTTVNKIIGIIF